MRLVQIVFVGFLIFPFLAQASYMTASGASGQNQYRDYGLKAKWSIPKSGRILTAFQGTQASGSTTNEYKLGYDASLSEVTSYDFKGYLRSEPSDVSVIGVETEWSFDYEDLIFDDLGTGFSLGLEFSSSRTELKLPGKLKLNQSFGVAGFSLGLNQEVIEDLKVYLGASFYKYNEPETRFPVGRRRLINLTETGDGLSTVGYPDRIFSFYVNYDWAENWSNSYSLTDTETHFDDQRTLFSSLGLDHTFTNAWSGGLAYSWSSGGASTGSLNATYSW